MNTFIGHLHPLLVHLPIGVWLVYLLLSFLSTKEKYKEIFQINKIIFLFGAISATLSIITGLINANQEGHDSNVLNSHQWIAIGTTVLFVIHFCFRSKLVSNNLNTLSICLLFTFLCVTGHLGGQLTHGEGYLSLQSDEKKEFKALTIKNIDEAFVYQDLVQYIFDKNCVSCHGEKKKKGNLRLDTYQHLMAGGRSGKIIQLNQLEKSELIKRMFLDESDEKHMPPKGTPQLFDFELRLLKSWVLKGASANARVHDISSDTPMILSIKKFQEEFSQKNKKAIITRPLIKAIDAKTINKLQSSGWSIMPLTTEDSYYRAVAFNINDSIETALEELQSVSNNIVELKLSFTNLSDHHTTLLSKFKVLEKLWLDHTKITSNSVNNLKELKNLIYLNLFATSIQSSDLNVISKKTALKLIYPEVKDSVWKTTDTIHTVVTEK